MLRALVGWDKAELSSQVNQSPVLVSAWAGCLFLVCLDCKEWHCWKGERLSHFKDSWDYVFCGLRMAANFNKYKAALFRFWKSSFLLNPFSNWGWRKKRGTECLEVWWSHPWRTVLGDFHHNVHLLLPSKSCPEQQSGSELRVSPGRQDEFSRER